MIGEGVIARIFPPPFQPMNILRIPIVHLERKEKNHPNLLHENNAHYHVKRKI